MQPTSSFIKKVISFECPICFQEYNESDRYPTIICTGQHSLCLKCSDSYIFKKGNIGKCPWCCQEVQKSLVVRFRFLNQLRQTSELLRKGGKSQIEQRMNQTQLRNELKQEKDKNTWLVKQIEEKQQQMMKIKEKLKGLNEKIERIQKGVCAAQSWLDPKLQNFSFEGNSIICSQQNQIIFGSSRLRPQFTINIQKIGLWAAVGIVDKNYIDIKKLQVQHSHRITYWSDKICRNGKSRKTNEGKGFQEGDRLTVSVDFQSASVEWKIGNKTIHKVYNEQIKNKKIEWVPFIGLKEKGDRISIQ